MTDKVAFDEIRTQLPSEKKGTESLGALLSYGWALIKRYYWVILLTSALAVVGAYFATKQMPEIYAASSKLIFRTSSPNLFGKDIERVEFLDPGGRWQFSQFWNTQKEVLNSRWFAERVVKKEDLANNETFLPPRQKGDPRTPEQRLKAATGKLLGAYRVDLQRDSRVAVITVETQNPELSARIADSVAETYVEYTKEYQSGGINQLVDWFDSYVETKRKELEAAQSALQKYKRDHNILSLSYEDRQNLTASNMASVNEQLMQVRAELSAQEALLNQIEKMRSSAKTVDAVADLVDNAALKAAFGREAELKQELAKLKTRYLDDHPEVQAVQEQLTVVREQIDSELDRVHAAIENRVEVLKRNESNLQVQLAGLKENVFELNELGVEYNQLQERADNLGQLYETVLMRSAELDINSLYENNVTDILEHADVPSSPVSPKLPINLAVGLFAGILLGSGIIVLLEAFDNTIKSQEQIAQYTDKPLLAALPRLDSSILSTLEGPGESPADTITHLAPKSSFAEGIKTLRTNVMFMAPDNPPELLLVTSPGPGEGKTLTTVNMAIAMAQSGLKTIVVDSDMRRPRLHKALGLENDIGLSDTLSGRVEVAEAAKETDIENLSVLTSGDIPPNPSELLHADHFDKLVEQLHETYDRVIFDSPPLGAVADALVLSRAVDSVLLILKHGKTQRDLLRRSVDQLESIGAPFMGVVLNEISSDAAGYTYSYYYRYGYGEDDGSKKRPKHRLVG